MSWTTQKLAHYLGHVKMVVEFQGGVTGEDLERIFKDEALLRLARVRNTLCDEYMSDKEKLAYIWEQILEE